MFMYSIIFCLYYCFVFYYFLFILLLSLSTESEDKGSVGKTWYTVAAKQFVWGLILFILTNCSINFTKKNGRKLMSFRKQSKQ